MLDDELAARTGPRVRAAVEAVERGVAEPLGKFGGRDATDALGADKDETILAGERGIGVGPEQLERQRACPWDVSGDPLVLIADVDHIKILRSQKITELL